MSTFISIFTKKIYPGYIKLENMETPPNDISNQIYSKSNELYTMNSFGNEQKILSSNVIEIENNHILNSVETISINTLLDSSNAKIINVDNCTLTLPSASSKLSFIFIGTGTITSVEGLNVNLNGDKLNVVSNGVSWYII